jgi:ADP-heptose:LPS heptosyltransferase
MKEEMRRYCHRHSMKLITEPPLRELSQKLQGMHVFLGNDSGVTHLSAALGVRTWVLFGPTDPKEWAPQGAHVHVFVPETPPCGPDGRHADDGEGCVSQWIAPEAVSKAILDAMPIANREQQEPRRGGSE